MVKTKSLISAVDNKYRQTYISNYFRNRTKTHKVYFNKENDMEELIISPKKRPRPIETDSEYDTESMKSSPPLPVLKEEVNGSKLPLPLPDYCDGIDEEKTSNRIVSPKKGVIKRRATPRKRKPVIVDVITIDSSDEDFEPNIKIKKEPLGVQDQISSVEKVDRYLKKQVVSRSSCSSDDSLCDDVPSTTAIGVHKPSVVSMTPTKKRPNVLQNINESTPVSNRDNLVSRTSTPSQSDITVNNTLSTTPTKNISQENINDCTTLINSPNLNSSSDTIVYEPDVTTPKKKVKILSNVKLKMPLKDATLANCSLSPIVKSTEKGLGQDLPNPRHTLYSLAQPGTSSQALDLSMKENNAGFVKTAKKEIKEEDKKKLENQWTVKIMKKIVDYIISHSHLKSLLADSEIEMLERFFGMPNTAYHFFCFKLFTRIQKWQNIIKLAKELELQMSDPEIKDMYFCLSENGFVDTDYSSEPCADLLNLLLKSDLKDLCQSFFKIRTGSDKKPDMIQKLLKNCNRQTTLTSTMTIENVLKEGIKQKMGICVKLSPLLYSLFNKIHLLYSFTTNDFTNISDLHFYVSKIMTGDIVMPDFKVNTEASIFSSLEEFAKFSEAYECDKAALQSTEKKETAVLAEICDVAYTKLQEILEQPRIVKPLYLMRFTPGYIYTRIIAQGAKHLAQHYPLKVSHWLTCLIDQNQYCMNSRGSWYNLLIMVQYRYLKDHDVAANTLIEALKQTNLLKVHLYDLNHRAEMMKRNKSNNVSELLKNKIAFNQHPPIKEVPIVEIQANLIREETQMGRKCLYIEKNEQSQEVSSVEDTALKYYFKQGYPNGIHCEGSLMQTIFFVLFWDIIYNSPVPDVFVQELQHYPLDLMSVEFYTNRKKAIDRRLLEIEMKWPYDQLKNYIFNVWDMHAYEKSFICPQLVEKPEQLYEIIMIIGRDVIAKILEKMAKDFKTYKSGHPDLFVWSVRKQKCKFVEVKSENDKLSTKQELWLEFLLELGTDVEVCQVYSRGCRKIPKSVLKKKKEEKE